MIPTDQRMYSNVTTNTMRQKKRKIQFCIINVLTQQAKMAITGRTQEC